jgi:RHS repeat-associated protein
MDLMSEKKTTDDQNVLISWTEVGYDRQPVDSVSGLPQFQPESSVLALPTDEITHDPQQLLGDITKRSRYNQAGLIVGTYDPKGNQETSEYDPTAGCGGSLVTRTKDALGHSSTTAYYCGSGAVASTTDANGLKTQFEYDDPLLRVTKITHPTGAYEVSNYDNATLINTHKYFSIDGGTTTQRSYTITHNDSAGRPVLVETMDPNGGAGMVSKTTEYDALGRAIASTNVYGRRSWSELDALGRIVKNVLPDGATTSAVYLGRIVQSRDAHQRVKEVEADGFGQIIRVRSEDGADTFYDYDQYGNMYQVRQSSGQVRNYTFDGFRRPLTSSIPERSGVQKVLAYDANSKAVDIQSADGYLIHNEYDALDRPTTITYTAPSGKPATPTAVFTYDTGPYAIGKLSSLTEGNISRAFTRDSFSMLQVETVSIGTNTYPTTYERDDFGVLKSITLPSGRKISYKYNQAGNLDTATTTVGSKSIDFISSMSYAPHGAVQARTYGNGLAEARQYDYDSLRMTRLDAGSVFSMKYNYNPTAPTACKGASTGGFASAPGGALESVDENIAGKSRHLAYTYDCLDRLVTAQATGASTWTLNYDFDAANNLTSQTGVAAIDKTLGFDGANHVTGFGYDSAGNVTDDGKTKYVYDGAGRAVEATDSSGKKTQYRYLGNQRLAKIDPSGKETNYIRLYSGTLVSEFESSSSSVTAEADFYYHRDLQGSVRMISDSSRAPAQATNYYPYGEKESTTGSLPTDRFAGHDLDTETGNFYMMARYFSTTTKGMLSIDQGAPDIHHPTSWNRYIYANHNPVMYVDPSGDQAANAGANQQKGAFTKAADAAVTAWQYSSSMVSILGGTLGRMIHETIPETEWRSSEIAASMNIRIMGGANPGLLYVDKATIDFTEHSPFRSQVDATVQHVIQETGIKPLSTDLLNPANIMKVLGAINEFANKNYGDPDIAHYADKSTTMAMRYGKTDLGEILANKAGVCRHMALHAQAVLAAMGVPSKLISSTDHEWLEVYRIRYNANWDGGGWIPEINSYVRKPNGYDFKPFWLSEILLGSQVFQPIRTPYDTLGAELEKKK